MSSPVGNADKSPPATTWGPRCRSRRGGRHFGRILLFLAIAVLGATADLVSKWWVFAWLGMPGEQPVWWLVPEVAGFQTSLNEGALFGMGQGFSLLFAALSVVAAVGVFVWLFFCGASEDLLLTISLACVTAGIFGNLYDRLGLHGLRWPPGFAGHQPGEAVYAVRDFILVMIGDWPWPTFNIADSLLVCGAALLLLHATLKPGESAESPAGDTATSTRPAQRRSS